MKLDGQFTGFQWTYIGHIAALAFLSVECSQFCGTTPACGHSILRDPHHGDLHVIEHIFMLDIAVRPWHFYLCIYRLSEIVLSPCLLANIGSLTSYQPGSCKQRLIRSSRLSTCPKSNKASSVCFNSWESGMGVSCHSLPADAHACVKFFDALLCLMVGK